MNWGLRNRLGRILPGLSQGSGSVMFAIDHGYFMGPTTGLENPRETIVPLLPHADSLMLSRGILQNSIPKQTNIPIVLRVSSGNSILNDDLSNEKLCVSIEDAHRYNDLELLRNFTKSKVIFGLIKIAFPALFFIPFINLSGFVTNKSSPTI